MITFGSSIFKIIRLLFIALLSVHFFACAFYRVKKESAISQEDVENFFLSRNAQPAVRACISAQALLLRKTHTTDCSVLPLAGSSNGLCEYLLPSW